MKDLVNKLSIEYRLFDKTNNGLEQLKTLEKEFDNNAIIKITIESTNYNPIASYRPEAYLKISNLIDVLKKDMEDRSQKIIELQSQINDLKKD